VTLSQTVATRVVEQSPRNARARIAVQQRNAEVQGKPRLALLRIDGQRVDPLR